MHRHRVRSICTESKRVISKRVIPKRSSPGRNDTYVVYVESVSICDVARHGTSSRVCTEVSSDSWEIRGSDKITVENKIGERFATMHARRLRVLPWNLVIPRETSSGRIVPFFRVRMLVTLRFGIASWDGGLMIEGGLGKVDKVARSFSDWSLVYFDIYQWSPITVNGIDFSHTFNHLQTVY